MIDDTLTRFTISPSEFAKVRAFMRANSSFRAPLGPPTPMSPLALLLAREQVYAVSMQAWLDDVPMTWLRA